MITIRKSFYGNLKLPVNSYKAYTSNCCIYADWHIPLVFCFLPNDVGQKTKNGYVFSIQHDPGDDRHNIKVIKTITIKNMKRKKCV
jgi:hypothetical protein